MNTRLFTCAKSEVLGALNSGHFMRHAAMCPLRPVVSFVIDPRPRALRLINGKVAALRSRYHVYV